MGEVPVGAIAGALVGVMVVAILAVVLLVVLVLRRRRRKIPQEVYSQERSLNNPTYTGSVTSE